MQCLSHAFGKQIRNQTGIEIARTYYNVVRVDYGFTSTRVDVSVVSDKPGIHDILIDVMGSFSGILGRNIDELLSDYLRPVLKSDSNMYILKCCRYDTPMNVEHFRKCVHGRFKIPGYIHKRRQQDVSDLIAPNYS